MTWSPKLSELISYMLYPARVGGWDLDKNKTMLCHCLGLFRVTIFHILKNHMKRTCAICFSKWPGAQGQNIKVISSEARPSLLKVWSVAPRTGITWELEMQNLGNPQP